MCKEKVPYVFNEEEADQEPIDVAIPVALMAAPLAQVLSKLVEINNKIDVILNLFSTTTTKVQQLDRRLWQIHRSLTRRSKRRRALCKLYRKIRKNK